MDFHVILCNCTASYIIWRENIYQSLVPKPFTKTGTLPLHYLERNRLPKASTKTIYNFLFIYITIVTKVETACAS